MFPPHTIRPASRLALYILICWLYVTPATGLSGEQQPLADASDEHKTGGADPLPAFAETELPADAKSEDLCQSVPGVLAETLNDLSNALGTMQSRYFQLWLGTWPEAIDWTAAVMGTHLSASIYTMAKSAEEPFSTANQGNGLAEAEALENEMNRYFSQAVAYYFGQDAFAIRMQAYDDMLWVVLGWLEQIRFINRHLSHHDHHAPHANPAQGWYGEQFAPAFAHRAHVFYEIASRGWDSRLCGGGMIWNPSLEPYKNAITNELFISASVGMYLDFPGDNNSSPYVVNEQYMAGLNPATAYDPKYLNAAVEGYDWLRASNMTNAQGLYVDGYHITGWKRNESIGTGKCDARDEMVYTYNQGVLLSGLRGLWEGTGHLSYLEDGHALIRSVIAATGWNVPDTASQEEKESWAGLGRNGIVEEFCDAAGSCSQDGQTFKGIFFHHLSRFCEPLPRRPRAPGKTFGASPAVAMLHRQSCKEYASWVAHNAQAALRTRDENGLFGTWWGAPGKGEPEIRAPLLPRGAVDYRNDPSASGHERQRRQENAWSHLSTSSQVDGVLGPDNDVSVRTERDWNDRGRGRTVETQGSGLAVVRALWEFSSLC